MSTSVLEAAVNVIESPRKKLTPQEVLRHYCSTCLQYAPDCGAISSAVGKELHLRHPMFLFLGSVNFFLADNAGIHAEKQDEARRLYGFATMLDDFMVGSPDDFKRGTFSTMSMKDCDGIKGGIKSFEYQWNGHVVAAGSSIFFHWKDGALPIHDEALGCIAVEDSAPSRMPQMGDVIAFRLHGTKRQQVNNGKTIIKNSVKAYPWMLDDDLEEACRQFQHRKEYRIVRRTVKKGAKVSSGAGSRDEVLWFGNYAVQRANLAEAPCYSTQSIVFETRQWSPGDTDDDQPKWKAVPSWIGQQNIDSKDDAACCCD